MYDKILEEVEKETIVLFNIKSIKDSSYKYIEPEPENDYDYYSYFNEYRKNLSKEVTLEEANELRKESLLFYDIKNQQEDKELERAFHQIKLQINFPNEPHVLREGKFYTISQGNFIAYDSKLFKKIYELPNMIDNKLYFPNQKHLGSDPEKWKIISVVQLENNDLVFAIQIPTVNYWKNLYEITIFRLKDKEFSLFQSIKEDSTGFSKQWEYSGCLGDLKNYNVLFLKEISGNRFFCISNYGFKIYSLNEKNEYCLISLGEHIDGYQIIQEISENKFIFCNKKSYEMFFGSRSHDDIYIDMIEVNEIKNFDENNKINKPEWEKTIEKFKLSSKKTELFNYSDHFCLYSLSDGVLIQKKFFVMIIYGKMLIFDVIIGKLLKIYQILIDANDNLYIDTKMNIKKWNNLDDNEFILLIEGNIILFELREDETKDIQLKIINQYYSQNMEYYNVYNIKKLSEKSNKFYVIDDYDKNISLL